MVQFRAGRCLNPASLVQSPAVWAIKNRPKAVKKASDSLLGYWIVSPTRYWCSCISLRTSRALLVRFASVALLLGAI